MAGGEILRCTGIILGGFETAYMQKLALYLKSRLGESVQVGISEKKTAEVVYGSSLSGASGSAFEHAAVNTVWVGSESFLAPLQECPEKNCCILLSEDVPAQASGPVPVIWRYQSCENLYREILLACPQLVSGKDTAAAADGPKWFAAVTDAGAAGLLAFSLTLAQILAESGRVLYLNLSACSGMNELFGTDGGMDLGDLIAKQRREEEFSLDAYVRRLGQADAILPPANPLILGEISSEDMNCLVERICRESSCDFVVAAFGTACCGMDHILYHSEQIFQLTGSGSLQAFSRKEWLRLLRLCTGGREEAVSLVPLPQLEVPCCGSELLYAWKQGVPGQLVRRYLNRNV